VSRVDGWLLAGAAILATAALASGLGRTDLWAPDEPRVAEIAREMSAGASWVIPTLNGRPFVEEPPLFYWLQGSLYRLVGAPSTVAARVPAATAAIAGVVVTAALAARLGASPVLAALVLASVPEYWWMARSATPDTTATLGTTLGLAGFFVAWRSGRRAPLVATAGAIGLAFACKSLLPVGLAVLAAGAFVAGAGVGRLSVAAVAWTVTGVAAVTAAWVALLAARLGVGAAGFFLFANHLGRLVGIEAEGHVRSPLYYLANLSLDAFPWSLVLPAAAVAAWRARALPECRFPLFWAAAMLIGLTLSASKRAHYLLPAYPAFAILIARWWPQAWDARPDRISRRLMVVSLAAVGPLLALVLLGIPAAEFAAAAHRLRSLPAVSVAALSGWSPTVAGAVVATCLALAGLPLLGADHHGNMARTATVMGAYLAAVHLLLVLVVLPRLNPLATSRPEAERLGRLAAQGVRVVAFRPGDSQTLSPILFYARRELPEIESAERLRAEMGAGPACALIRAEDQAALADSLPGSPVRGGVLPGSRFVLLETAPGLCTADRP